MRVIITGGTGLIGSALSADLAKNGYEVIVLSRNPQRHLDRLPEGVQAEWWDARSAASWGHLANGAYAIVNLAGENISGEGFFPARWTPDRKKAILQSRINAGKAVVEAVKAAEIKPKVLIQSSAIGYYGPLGNETVVETDPPGNDFFSSVCVDWEESTKSVEEMGVRRVVTRSGVILSTLAGALPRLLLPFQLFAGGPFGTGKQWLSWIHLEDEIKAIRFLLDLEVASGPFNLTAPEPVTNAEFGRTLGRVMRRPSWFPVPGFGLKLAFGEVSTVVLDGQRVIPSKLQEMGFEFDFPSAHSALTDLLT